MKDVNYYKLDVNCRSSLIIFFSSFILLNQRKNFHLQTVRKYFQTFSFFKSNVRNFLKRIIAEVFDKILHTKNILLKNPFFMFLAHFIFVVSLLKINPAVHLNALKALTSS